MVIDNCKRKNCFTWIFILYAMFGRIYGTDGFIPSDGWTLNYTQILFSWPQIPNSVYYKLIINSEDRTYIVYDSTNMIIYSQDFEWGNSYSWQVCGLDTNDIAYCHDSLVFSIYEIQRCPVWVQGCFKKGS